MQQLGEIRVSGGQRLTIDIDGLIGIPEGWAFGDDAERAATYDSFRSQVDRIGGSGARRIEVNIRSVGGNIHDALLIYDALCALAADGAEITTSCHGYVASAATVIAQAASPGRRLVSENALYLVHNATASLEGNSLDAGYTARLLDKTDERIAQIYADRSGRPAGEFRELMARGGGRGEWLSAAEAVAAGLADRVSRRSPLAVVRDKVAGAVRNLFGTPAPVPALLAIPEGFPLLPVPDGAGKPGVRIPQAAAGDDGVTPPAVSVAEECLRQRAQPSATQPREDPAVAPMGVLDFGAADLSGNGAAYDSDASRFRMGY